MREVVAIMETGPLGGRGVRAADPRRGLGRAVFPLGVVADGRYACSTEPHEVYFVLALETRIGFGAF
jgi:hypothetical protein